MQPISCNAAGVTNAQRNEMAMRTIGGQLHRVPTRPADDKQDDDPHRGRLFTPNSHLLHVRRVPYGFDERDADRGSAAALPEADCFGRGPSPAKRRPVKFEDSSFSFHGEGTVAEEAAEDEYRPCKARALVRVVRAPRPPPPTPTRSSPTARRFARAPIAARGRSARPRTR